MSQPSNRPEVKIMKRITILWGLWPRVTVYPQRPSALTCAVDHHLGSPTLGCTEYGVQPTALRTSKEVILLCSLYTQQPQVS
jgi:hypothetical protein